MYRTVLCLALLSFVSSFLTGRLPCLLKPKCCPDGECYDLCPPWTTLKHPVPSPSCSVNPVKYLLSNRCNPKYPVVFSTANFSKIQDYYDVSKPTVIVFHGHGQSEDTSDMRNITANYLLKVDANAIYVDYRIIAKERYLKSVADIRIAARYVARAVKTLIEFGTSPSAIHLIGHSLGAHFAAYVAKNVADIGLIGRLTGLDAAGPAFEGADCKVRFCKSDAVFTETIHTNGHPKKGYGTSDEDAHVVFLVNGGWDQPKCPFAMFQLDPVVTILEKLMEIPDYLCSHQRSVTFYNEALAGDCTFWGVTPNASVLRKSRQEFGYPTKDDINTTGCTLHNCVPIGLQTINAKGRGNFIVPTNHESPFCVSQP